MQLPPPVPVGDHPQVAEVQLHLPALLPVGHRHRHPRPRRRVPALLSREPRQRPVRHRRTGPLQQLLDLHQSQVGLHPPRDLGLPRNQRLPRDATPGRAGRAHRRHHLPQQLITQLRLIPVAGQARRLPRPDIPRGGLHIHARPPGRRALARPGQPRPQDLSHLCHQNLPERHPLPSLPVRNEPGDHSRVVHQLANQVVPSPWQQPSAGGPMLMADDRLRSDSEAWMVSILPAHCSPLQGCVQQHLGEETSQGSKEACGDRSWFIAMAAAACPDGSRGADAVVVSSAGCATRDAPLRDLCVGRGGKAYSLHGRRQPVDLRGSAQISERRNSCLYRFRSESHRLHVARPKSVDNITWHISRLARPTR